MGVGTTRGAGAHADFSEDDHAAQGALRLIVGRLQIRVFQKGEQARFILVLIGQPALEDQRLLIAKRPGADRVQLAVKAAATAESGRRADFARPQLAALL